MTVIHPDIEKIVVEFLSEQFTQLDTDLTSGVRVATKKSPPDAPQPSKQVIVTGSYNTSLEGPLRAASLVLDVWADDYATASDLALLVAAVIVQVIGDPVKRAVVTLGPVRLAEEGPQELRSMSVDLVVKGANL